MVLVKLPQADGVKKLRPAVVIRQVPPFDDWLLCAVSKQTHNAVPDFDFLIDETHPEYGRMSLKCASVVRLGKLYAMPGKEIIAEIGVVSETMYTTMIQRLTAWLQSR